MEEKIICTQLFKDSRRLWKQNPWSCSKPECANCKGQCLGKKLCQSITWGKCEIIQIIQFGRKNGKDEISKIKTTQLWLRESGFCN